MQILQIKDWRSTFETSESRGYKVLTWISLPVALWLGAKLFRVGLLIYGQRPTLREIWGIVRG